MNGEITTRVRLIQNQTVAVIAEHALSEPHFWRRVDYVCTYVVPIKAMRYDVF